MNWYKIARLQIKNPDDDVPLYRGCMFCKRWGTVPDNAADSSPTIWKKEEDLSQLEKKQILEAKNEALKGCGHANIGVTHGICSYCWNIMGGVRGYPNGSKAIDELINKSLSLS
jgi:hypothetical protein